MIEKQIEINSGDVVLSGTLTTPTSDSSHSIVLFLHGSGPLDRDENIKGMQLNIFNKIAFDLAKRNIASFRYDKRGCSKSTGDYYTSGFDDLIVDATACAKWLSEQSEFTELILLGHSEGTLIAPIVSQRVKSVGRLVLLCPFLKNLETVLVAQSKDQEKAISKMSGIKGFTARLMMKYIISPVKYQKKLIKRIKSSNQDSFKMMFQRIPAKWLRELMAVEPREFYEKIDIATLLLIADKDVQCDPADGDEIQNILGSLATKVNMPNLTHILRNDPNEHTILSYKKLLKQPIDKEVLQVIGNWLKKSKPAN